MKSRGLSTATHRREEHSTYVPRKSVLLLIPQTNAINHHHVKCPISTPDLASNYRDPQYPTSNYSHCDNMEQQTHDLPVHTPSQCSYVTTLAINNRRTPKGAACRYNMQ